MVYMRSEKPVCAPPCLSEVPRRCLSNCSNVRLIRRRALKQIDVMTILSLLFFSFLSDFQMNGLAVRCFADEPEFPGVAERHVGPG